MYQPIYFSCAILIPSPFKHTSFCLCELEDLNSLISMNSACGADWHTFGNSCYTVVKETKLTWLEAERRCKTIGGHLVSIGNIDEMEYIHYLVTVIVKGLDDDSAYIGKKNNKCFVIPLLAFLDLIR